MSLGKFRYALAVAAVSAFTLVGAAAAPSAAFASTAPVPTSAAPTPISGGANSVLPRRVIGDCPATYLCVWVNANYSGGPAKFAGNNDHWSAFPSQGCQVRSWNDCASSGYNHGTSGLGVEVYRDNYYSGLQACLPKGWHNGDFSKLVWGGTNNTFNDSISSNFWTDAC
jgi:hypothetical protein